ncbi:hypothetical protein KY284_001297 [Solanum tuberosum]|nr:hypothetical protein KY284_001297 [Solanum tuberosum]
MDWEDIQATTTSMNKENVIAEIPLMQIGVNAQTIEIIDEADHLENKDNCGGASQLKIVENNMQITTGARCRTSGHFNGGGQRESETKASNWVNSHILELSNTYGVAFEGFEKETLDLLMRIDEWKVVMDKNEQGKAVTTQKSKGIGKNNSSLALMKK